MSVKSETRLPVRLFNALAPLFGAFASSEFHPDGMLESAAKRYGSDDFGDGHFLEGLRVLCRSVNTEAKLHSFGQLFSKFVILNLLRNRLELSQRWKEHPEVLTAPIERPVFIVGSPRTGTTLLFNLLAQDERFRYFRSWEAGRAGLPRGDQAQVEKARKESRKTMGTFNYLRPELKKIHHLAVEKPEECNFLLANSFEASFFFVSFMVRSYQDWFYSRNHDYAYAYYTKQLQWMQSKTPGKRWLLKAPAHLLAFGTLFDQFPDAVVLQTHRDPQESLPSMCSLRYSFRSMLSYAVRKEEIGENVLNHHSKDLQTALALREERKLNVFDIQYSDLIESPMAVLKQAYEYIGENFSEAVQAEASGYLASNPKDKFGRHTYSNEEFGLDRKTILEKFDFYYQRFNFATR